MKPLAASIAVLSFILPLLLLLLLLSPTSEPSAADETWQDSVQNSGRGPTSEGQKEQQHVCSRALPRCWLGMC
jgi:hypothetical protein